ncbi:MAG: hypothetical protein HPY66_2303 [Firmicutes bacterium]|nr:hypothetical protein [Bacillota bacterium]
MRDFCPYTGDIKALKDISGNFACKTLLLLVISIDMRYSTDIPEMIGWTD